METNAETNTGTNPETNAAPNESPPEISNEPANAPAIKATSGAPAPQKTRRPRRQKAVIDRIEEGKYAVLLVGNKQVEKSIPVEQLPEGARAGSWLKVRVTDDGVRDMLVDETETQAAQERVRSKLEMLRDRQSYFKSLTPAEGQNGGIQPLNPSPSEPRPESQEGEWQASSEQQESEQK